jgi:hypothetical protein
MALDMAHMTPEVSRMAMHQLTEGRSLAYKITSFSSETQLVEARAFDFATFLDEDSFAGYDPLAFRGVEAALGGLRYHCILSKNISPDFLNHFSNWSGRYLITEDSSERADEMRQFSQLRFKELTPSGLAVYENLSAKPYAWFEGRTDRSLPTRLKANSVSIDTTGCDGLLTISLFNVPGWSVRFDQGTFQSIESSNADRQIQVNVPHGVQSVTLRYRPALLIESSCLAAGLLAVLLPLWIWFERFFSGADTKPVRTTVLKNAHTPARVQQQVLARRLKLICFMIVCVWVLLSGIYVTKLIRHQDRNPSPHRVTLLPA